MNQENVVIVGSGPAAHTAAIYAARAKLNPLIFEGFMAGGVAAGGQLTTTTDVENYPGYTNILGPELMEKMREQSLHCGARIETKTVDKVDLSNRPFKIYIGEKSIESKTLIIATGATAKRLDKKFRISKKDPDSYVAFVLGVGAQALGDALKHRRWLDLQLRPIKKRQRELDDIKSFRGALDRIARSVKRFRGISTN